MSDNSIRKARPSDVPAIHALIQTASKVVPVIPKSHFEIYADMRDFFVFDEGNGVQGVLRFAYYLARSGGGQVARGG